MSISIRSIRSKNYFEEGRYSMSFLVKVILVVSSNGDRKASFIRLLANEPRHYAKVVTSGSDALNFVKHIKPQLLMLDYDLPDMNGIDLYELLLEAQQMADVPAIIVGVPLPKQALAVTRKQLVLLSSHIDLQTLLREMRKISTLYA
jgi:CheY-like chemotaxis protein